MSDIGVELLDRERRDVRRRADDGDTAAHEIGRELRQSLNTFLRKLVIDGHILVFRKAGLRQPATKCSDYVPGAIASVRVQPKKSNHREGGLFRLRKNRARDADPKERDDLPPPCMSGKEHSEG